jgi:hypothetical protein
MKLRFLIVTALLASFAHAEVAGVSPASACNYLTGNGLPTTTYRQQADGTYRCSSPPVDIGTIPGRRGRLNNIAYAVAGSAESIAVIQLVIDVDNPEQAPAIHRRLKDVAKVLAHKLGLELSVPVEEAIASGSTIKGIAGKYTASVVRTDRFAGGYEVKVMFE